MESRIDFVVADMPDANRLTIHLIAAVAEYERHVISERTKAALGRAKAAGKRLGNPQIRSLQSCASSAASSKADAFAISMQAKFDVYDPAGDLSATKLADVLNAEDVRSARGGRWTATTVIALRRKNQGNAIAPGTDDSRYLKP